VLSQAGLGAALEAVTERLPLRVELHVDDERPHPDVENAAYLIVCEALTNAARHAGECIVTVDVHRESHDLRVRIADDGIGCNELNAPTALPGLQDRVSALGGQLQVHSSRGCGTVVEAVLPCA
jgi:signal transduction histidine kinase